MASMSAVVAESRAHFGKEAWGLVNCAGVMHYQYISDLDAGSRMKLREVKFSARVLV